MALVREDLNFKRGIGAKKSLSVGEESYEGKKQRAWDLQSKIMGVTADAMELFIENIGEYEIAIKNLIDIGVPPDDISVILHSAKIRVLNYRIIKGNVVVGNTLIKTDGDILIKQMLKYDTNANTDPDYFYVEIETRGQYFFIPELKDFFKRRGWEWKE